MLSKIILLSLLILSHQWAAFGQQLPLPLYEIADNGAVWLLRMDSTTKRSAKEFDAVSTITAKGACYGNLNKLRVITQKECCTHPDPEFLLGRVKMDDKDCKGQLILGKIDNGRLLNYDSLKAKTNVFEWISEEYNNPLVNKEHLSKYRWAPSEIDGKKDVYLHAKTKNNGKDVFTTYRVSLKECVHLKTDSIDFFYCTTDTSGNSKKTDLNWFHERIKWSLLYVNKKLIYVTPDFTGTGLDGFGPFHYKEQKLHSIYKANAGTFYSFLPGYVIYHKNKEWKQLSREPVQYYGECDCE